MYSRLLTATIRTVDLPSGAVLLRDIDLGLDPGDVILVTGPIGCGKSTLLRVLAGLWPPSLWNGEIVYSSNGGKVTLGPGIGPLHLFATVGYLHQDPSTNFATTRVADELVFSLENRGLSEDHVYKALDRLPFGSRLATILPRALEDLSEGERQIVALAALAILEAPVLLLDEPTAMLDETYTAEFLYYLARLQQIGRFAIVIATHRPQQFAALSPRVIDLAQHSVRPSRPAVETEPEGSDTVARGPLIRHDALTIENLSISTPQRGLLLTVQELQLPAGSTVMISGPNTSGKSLLARALALGVRVPRSNVDIRFQVRYADRVLDHKSVELAPQYFGLAFQSPRYRFFTESVNDELLLGTYGRFADPHSHALWMNILIRMLHPAQIPLFASPRDLSFGQQKLLLCAVNSPAPFVLLIDEPFYTPDELWQRSFRTLLQTLRLAGGTCVLLTHDPASYYDLADQAFLITERSLTVDSQKH